ncbi:MAG: hypothetical protein L0I62_11110 [Gammaproteobacteria bacterium]|nr:hypothetical protein [Gammaproteobacteria bacterium]
MVFIPTQDRNTPMQAGEFIPVAVVAEAIIYTGAIVCADANGYATPGLTSTTLTYLGRAEQQVDNSGGASGDKTVLVRRGKAFTWTNDASDSVDQSLIGKSCYITDDRTLAKTDAVGTKSKAGIVLAFDDDTVTII